jgi:hypothetical protein
LQVHYTDIVGGLELGDIAPNEHLWGSQTPPLPRPSIYISEDTYTNDCATIIP